MTTEFAVGDRVVSLSRQLRLGKSGTVAEIRDGLLEGHIFAWVDMNDCAARLFFDVRTLRHLEDDERPIVPVVLEPVAPVENTEVVEVKPIELAEQMSLF